MKQKTPQEKKLLSYAKDRRNDFGQNDKAARRRIPLRKALQRRAFRKSANQLLQKASGAAEVEKLEILESKVKSVKKGDWKKSPDAPLGKIVESKLEWRKLHAGKGQTARRKMREIAENLEVKIEQESGNRWIATATNFHDISAFGETSDSAIRKLKYLVGTIVGNNLGFNSRILVNGKYIIPIL